MSKLLIVSDSHGLTNELMAIKERHQQEVDLMIHCGDSQLMADEQAMAGFVGVRGNCDYDARYPIDRLENVTGKKVYVTHGHKYSVKSSLMSLYYRARELGAEIACFGHSHVLGAQKMGDILFINPGSIFLPRERRDKTYVILDIQRDKMLLSVYDVQGKQIPDLSCEFMVSNS
jgi:putative phosphoesterase